ncbi:outer membrane lipoprotein LolB [Paucibacter soli]|uniref:outer membrane lipoprotein LolB n=1 Tax=Paucibacter soli TaxID=3133433 RepID=UPI0030A1C185
MRPALALCACLALVACASVPPQPQAYQAQAEDLQLSGRLSVQVAALNGARAQGGNAGFELQGSALAGQLELSTPLGSLLARARWNGSEVLLQTPNDERRFDDLDALTRELLGEAIPIAAMFDWLQGRPWPQAAHRPIGEQGFIQLGWAVDLSRYAEGLIVARRSAEPEATLRVRLDPKP